MAPVNALQHRLQLNWLKLNLELQFNWLQFNSGVNTGQQYPEGSASDRG